MPLNHIAIYARPQDGFGADTGWLTNNVEFIYSVLLARRKVTYSRVTKLNLYLNDRRSRMEGPPEDRIARIDVKFSPDGIDPADPEGSQVRMTDAVSKVLKRLCGEGFKEVIQEVHDEVLATGFSVESSLSRTLHRSADNQFHVRIVMATGFDRTQVFADLHVARLEPIRFALYATRPSPMFVDRGFRSASIDDSGNLEVVVRAPAPEHLHERLFGYAYYDFAESTVTPSVHADEEAGSLTFKYALSEA